MNFFSTKTTPLDSFKLLSHPDTLLIKHLEDVAKSVKKRVDGLSIDEEVKDLAVKAALMHDFGKASIFFQERLKTGKKSRFSNHGLISAFFGYFITKNPYVFMAIRYHHLNLEDCEDMTRVSEKEKEVLLEIARNIDKEVEEIYKVFRIEFKLDDFIEFLEEKIDDMWGFDIEVEEKDFWDFLVIFSALISADKENAIFKGDVEEIKIKLSSDFVDYYKQKHIKKRYEIDEVREKIYKVVSNLDTKYDAYFLELPTGAGKTFSLIKLALKFHKKIFYLLPFITLIEQNATIFKNILKENGIDVEDNRVFYEKHSLSGAFNVKNRDEYDLDKREFLSDDFSSKVIVTTFHQFFYSFFKSKNSFLKRAINIRNSVVILDEIQAIREDLFVVIEELFKFLIEKFNCKIIIATATLPPINIKNSVKVKIEDILEKDEFKFFNRYKVNLEIKEFDEDSVLDFIDEKLKTSKDLLFRVNTINAANYIFDSLENAILLTSVIPPILRQKRIKQIKKRGGVVVATQVIQAGVDISLEDGFEELAPLDMLVQSMGRRNRSGEKGKGYAEVIRLKINRFDGSRVYDRGLIRRTERIIRDKKIVNEEEFRELLREYYKNIRKNREILKSLRECKFSSIDRDFRLIDEVKSVSFFCVIDEKSEKLWQKLLELDEREKELKANFWDEKREIEEEFSKIKKDVFLYVANARIYEREYEIDNEFERALFLYKADERVFDIEKGVSLKEFFKEERIFW